VNCDQVQATMTDQLLGEISGLEPEGVTRHIESCAACAGDVERLRRTIDWVRTQAATEKPVLDPQHRDAVHQAAPQPVRHRPRAALSAIAATLLIGALGTWQYWRTRPPEQPAPYKPVIALALPQAPPTAVPLVPAAPHRDELTVAASETLRGHGYVGDVEQGVEGGVAGGVEGGVAGGVVGGVPGGVVGGCVGCMGGGLVPPNGAPVHDMYFQHQGTNPFVQTDEDKLSTFGLDVDTASYTLTRSYILRGALPPPDAVRVEEFVNAFPPSYGADPEKTFAVHLAGALNPFHPGYHFLRIGLKAREIPARERKPAILTFVIDVSGSMGMENRLGLVKRSLELLVDKLDERDRIGIVVYGTNGRVVLRPTGLDHPETIRRAIRALEPEGSTNLEEGLSLGYDMAARSFQKDASNRVILCTDGVANNGVTSAEELLAQVSRRARQGIDLMALGFGMGNYNDVLLQKLADQGNGQYAYIDDYREAQSFFLRDLTSVLELVARDAKAQVEFDPARVERYRLIGYEKRDIADRDFRNEAVDGGEINSGHAVTVLYEVKLREGSGAAGVVRIRYADPGTRRVTEDAVPIGADVFMPSFTDADPSLRLSVVIARFAEHLRRSYWVKEEPLADVVREAEDLPVETRGGETVAELIHLMHQAVRLERPPRAHDEGR
jgi:Ca-activated chloride channel family protein